MIDKLQSKSQLILIALTKQKTPKHQLYFSNKGRNLAEFSSEFEINLYCIILDTNYAQMSNLKINPLDILSLSYSCYKYNKFVSFFCCCYYAHEFINRYQEYIKNAFYNK